ncbi:MAG TPA: Sapep family Mn(2+)-dependent dipeptidase [Thermoanaerobaculia bacterium]
MFIAFFFAAALAANVNAVQRHYDRVESKRLVPLLTEVLQFPTVAGDDEAFKAQRAWLEKTAHELGLVFRDVGKISEVELPGPKPVLGLVVHGDVQPVDADAWSFPPFSGRISNGYVLGRGSADDKGPLVQALLAMAALKNSGIRRTHTIRLLVGSNEESESTDITEYLKDHAGPDYSLVIDSSFPVVVGEKAWNSLTVTTPLIERQATRPYIVTNLTAGLSPSIVPDNAEIDLRWNSGAADWQPLIDSLTSFRLPEGTRLVTKADGDALRIVAYGHSAHSGMNLEGGRNALVALARAMEGKLPAGGADDLLAFARRAGSDLYGGGLGITDSDPLWGHYAVNVAMIKPDQSDPKKSTLTINIRRIPPRTGPQLKQYLQTLVADFNAQRGAALVAGGFYGDEPLVFDPKAKIVRRLLRDYAAATGEKNPQPAISGGGTYAKRLPNSIAFGMWFPDKPYPGHDVDEKIPIADLERGERVLIRTLVDIATGPKIVEPFKP